MSDLDKDDTRTLARELVEQLAPHLRGSQLDDAAKNLMRLAARMAGHLGHAIEERNFDNDPYSDGSAGRMAAIGSEMEAAAHDTGETLANGEACWACRVHGCDGETCR
jgi:hypothetical protein